SRVCGYPCTRDHTLPDNQSSLRTILYGISAFQGTPKGDHFDSFTVAGIPARHGQISDQSTSNGRIQEWIATQSITRRSYCIAPWQPCSAPRGPLLAFTLPRPSHRR